MFNQRALNKQMPDTAVRLQVNQLIEALPRKDRKELLLHCTPVQLTLADVLAGQGAVTTRIYFPLDAFISLVTQTEGSPALEVGMVGNEGMAGVHLVLGVATAPTRAVVQGAGTALCISAIALRRQLVDSPALRRALLRYVYVLMAQMSNYTACLRFHEIEPRLARWLLMTADRAHSSRFSMTHEFLAFMLGVRRVGVTQAAGALQRVGLIEYHRGDMQISNRAGLERAACACYATDRRIYTQVMA